MLRLLKNRFLLLTLSLAAVNAYAQQYPQPPYNPQPPSDNIWTTCHTSASGYSYDASGYGITNTRNQVITSCATYGLKSVCSYNTTCDRDYLSPFYKISTTSSSGTRFVHADASLDVALGRLIQNCSTNNAEGPCRYNVIFENGLTFYYSKVRINIQGRSFVDADRDANVAIERAVRACSSSYLNAQDCRYYARVEQTMQPTQPQQPPYNPQPQPQPPFPQPQPPYPQPLPPAPVPVPGNPNQPGRQPGGRPPVNPDRRQYVCTTHSNGRSFSVPGRGYERTRNVVIQTCSQSVGTNAYECQRNAYCQ